MIVWSCFYSNHKCKIYVLALFDATLCKMVTWSQGLADQTKAFDHFSFGSFLNFLPTERVSRAKGVLTRVVRLAQRYLLDPMGRQKTEEKGSQTQTKPKQRSPAPGRVVRSRTSTSMTQAQVKLWFKRGLCSLFQLVSLSCYSLFYL